MKRFSVREEWEAALGAYAKGRSWHTRGSIGSFAGNGCDAFCGDECIGYWDSRRNEGFANVTDPDATLPQGGR